MKDDKPINILGPNNTQSSEMLRVQRVSINDKRELYKSYIPFLKNGALFFQFNQDILAHKTFIGQKITIMLVLGLLSDRPSLIKGEIIYLQKYGPIKGFAISLGDSQPMVALKGNIESLIMDMTMRKEPTNLIF
jgi:Tfp pilus assembly protein PilZ